MDRAPLCCHCDRHDSVTESHLCLECALVLLVDEGQHAEAEALAAEHGKSTITARRIVRDANERRDRAAMAAALRAKAVA